MNRALSQQIPVSFVLLVDQELLDRRRVRLDHLLRLACNAWVARSVRTGSFLVLFLRVLSSCQIGHVLCRRVQVRSSGAVLATGQSLVLVHFVESLRWPVIALVCQLGHERQYLVVLLKHALVW